MANPRLPILKNGMPHDQLLKHISKDPHRLMGKYQQHRMFEARLANPRLPIVKNGMPHEQLLKHISEEPPSVYGEMLAHPPV